MHLNPKVPIAIKAKFAGTGTEIQIGDQRIANVVSVTFRHRVGDVPTVELEILAKDDTRVIGEAAVTAIVLCPACKKEMEERSQTVQRNIEAIDRFSRLAAE